jgi:excisionase family DNA binding protein
MSVEVTVTNPAYWSDRAQQLALILGSAAEGGPNNVGDPTGKPPDPENSFKIADPMYWSGQPLALREVLGIAAGRQGVEVAVPGGASGAGTGSLERLTLTVEEAAAALGISRAFAYEAVTRKEIPHIRIGRRILIPRAALQRMLGSDSGTSTDTSENPL